MVPYIDRFNVTETLTNVTDPTDIITLTNNAMKECVSAVIKACGIYPPTANAIINAIKAGGGIIISFNLYDTLYTFEDNILRAYMSFNKGHTVKTKSYNYYCIETCFSLKYYQRC